MKRQLMVVAALVGLMICFTVTGYAQPDMDTDEDIDSVERLEYISKAQVDLVIEGKNAGISGVLKSISSQYRCELTLSLRKYENSNWNHVVDSWSATGSGIIGASINTQKTGLAAGKYRVHLSGKIYDSDNRLVETVSRDSVQKTVY